MQFTEKDIQLAETQNCEKILNLKVVRKRKKKKKDNSFHSSDRQELRIITSDGGKRLLSHYW